VSGPLDHLSEVFRQLNQPAPPALDGHPGLAIQPDLDREQRKGVPEVILAAGKPFPELLQLTRLFLERRQRAILSRISPEQVAALRAALPGTVFEDHSVARLLVVRQPGTRPPQSGGHVGLITAGTTDLPAATEAKVIAQEMGCRVTAVYDVGVAGLHRLFKPLHDLLTAGVDVIIVAAGMDGALPSVVAGLVDVPVIGLPTANGYGLGGQGVAALLSMLQTCAPGLVVVNIDNGIGAGATAALIANRVARARQAARERDVIPDGDAR
jgi:NCAIR mutase (PurE)-related protein